MNLLAYVGYFAVGLIEWALALTRTLACLRNRPIVVCVTVFIENFLGLIVLCSFVRTDNWLLALAYSVGASTGSMLPYLKPRLFCGKEVRKMSGSEGCV